MQFGFNRAFCLAMACAAGLLTAGSQAAVITWNFDNVTGATTPTVTSVPASSGTAANVTVGNLTGTGGNTTATGVYSNSTSTGAYTGASAANNYGLYVAPAGSGYYQVTFTPDAGYKIQLNDVNFGFRSTSTGPLRYTILSDANGDNFTTPIYQAAIDKTGSVYRYYDSSFASTTDPVAGEPVTVRILVDNGTGTTGTAANARMDDLTIDVAAITTAPEPVSAGLVAIGALPLIAGRRRKA